MADQAGDPIKRAIDAFRADDGRAARYDLYARYYLGDQDLAFATPKFETTFGRLFRAFAYNRCASVVDAHTDRLQVTGWDGPGADAATALWNDNRMDSRQGELWAEVMTAGDGALIVWPEGANGERRPTIWPQEARHVRFFYDDERPGVVTLAAKRWERHDKRTRLNLYFPDRLEKYVSRQPGAPEHGQGYEAFLDDGDEGGVVRYDWDGGVVPVFPFANNARTGRPGVSELRAIVPLQDALNKTLTDLMVAEELGAYPQRILIGLDTERDASTGQAVQAFQSGVGRILTLADENVKLAEFQAVALQQFVAIAEFWEKAVSRASKVPIHYLSLSGDFPSGRALRTAEAPFVAKLEDRQRAFGPVLAGAMALALRQGGVTAAAEPVWKSAAPLSEEDALDIALQKKAVGIDLLTILTDMGREDAEAIVARARLRAAEAMAAFDRGAFAGGDGGEDEDDGGEG